MPGETLRREYSMRLDCRYLLTAPPEPHLLVACLHGYGSNAEVMLRLTRSLLGDAHAYVSLEAPYPFYVSLAPDRVVGHNWATHLHSDASVRLHHDMLRYVLDEAGRAAGIGPERRVLVGFSQPVGMNYRFAATHPDEAAGVIGVCGGVPADWETGSYLPVSAALLHIARNEDEVYPPAKTSHFAERLRLRARDVEFHMLDGGHRFPSKAAPLAAAWVERVFRNTR
ncbi:MAG: hypothetical protein IPM24_22790 [Bryobacterales bacterium]|nr:hypothetical protein [Bryobacterales bacterium]